MLPFVRFLRPFPSTFWLLPSPFFALPCLALDCPFLCPFEWPLCFPLLPFSALFPPEGSAAGVWESAGTGFSAFDSCFAGCALGEPEIFCAKAPVKEAKANTKVRMSDLFIV